MKINIEITPKELLEVFQLIGIQGIPTEEIIPQKEEKVKEEDIPIPPVSQEDTILEEEVKEAPKKRGRGRKKQQEEDISISPVSQEDAIPEEEIIPQEEGEEEEVKVKDVKDVKDIEEVKDVKDIEEVRQEEALQIEEDEDEEEIKPLQDEEEIKPLQDEEKDDEDPEITRQVFKDRSQELERLHRSITGQGILFNILKVYKEENGIDLQDSLTPKDYKEVLIRLEDTYQKAYKEYMKGKGVKVK